MTFAAGFSVGALTVMTAVWAKRVVRQWRRRRAEDRWIAAAEARIRERRRAAS